MAHRSIWKLITISCLFGAVGCKPTPSVHIDDPAAYIHVKFSKLPLNHWIEPYQDRRPEFIKPFVDAFIEKETRLSKGLSHDSKKLDILIKNGLRGGYLRAMLDTPEGRDYIRARAQARLENPPMAMLPYLGNLCATLDYWVLPGDWVIRRASPYMSPDGLATVGGLDSALFRKSLQKLVTRFPDARNYEIRAIAGTQASKLRYWYNPASDLMRFKGSATAEQLFTRFKVGGLENLLSGKVLLEDIRFSPADQSDGDDSGIKHEIPPYREHP